MAGKHTDTVTGYKYTTLDGAEVLVNLQTNRTLQWDVVTFGKPSLSRIEKCSAPWAEGYVSMDRPEICEVARRTIDNVLGTENSSYTNTFKSRIRSY